MRTDYLEYYKTVTRAPPPDSVAHVPHTMRSGSLRTYVIKTKFSVGQKRLIEHALANDVPIEIHGIYVEHLRSVLRSRNLECVEWEEREPRRRKQFNTARPIVMFVRNHELGADFLWIVVFPSKEYVQQIAELVAAYAAFWTQANHAAGRDQSIQSNIQVMHYTDCYAALPDWSGLQETAAVVVDPGDLVIIGHVEEVANGLRQTGYSEVSSAPVGGGHFGLMQVLSSGAGRRVILLGVYHCFWGSAAGAICKCLAEAGATDIVYIAKAGTLIDTRAVHSLVCPDTYYVLASEGAGTSGVSEWLRYEVPSELRDQHRNLILRYASGAHLTVPTVVGETLTQSQTYRTLRPATIDNEIGYIARELKRHNETTDVGYPTHFTCLHFITDYVETIDRGNEVANTFDLSDVEGERGEVVRMRQQEAFLEAAKVIDCYVEIRQPIRAITFVGASKPPRILNWVGRFNEIEQLKSLVTRNRHHPLAARGSVTAITGATGVGKTALAGKLSTDLVSSGLYADQEWVSLRPDPITLRAPSFGETVDRLIERISGGAFRAPQIHKWSFQQKMELAIHLLTKKSWIIVFDNLETLLESGDAQRVGFFLPTTSRFEISFLSSYHESTKVR